MNSRRSLLVIAAFLLALILLMTFLPAAGAPQASGGVVLLAGGIADLEWEATYAQPFLRWELYRGPSAASVTRVAQSTDPAIRYYRDSGVPPGVTYYRLDAIRCVDECDGPEDERATVIFSDQVTAGYFQGRVRHDLALPAGGYEIALAGAGDTGAVTVEDGATLVAGSGVTIYGGLVHASGGYLEIDGTTLDDATASFGNYGDDASWGEGWVREATFANNSGVVLNGQSEVAVTGNTGRLNRVILNDAARATISGNERLGTVELNDRSRATIRNNTISNADVRLSDPGVRATISENVLETEFSNTGIRIWEGYALVADNSLSFTGYHGSESTVLLSVAGEDAAATVERNSVSNGKVGIWSGSTVTVTDNVLSGGGSAISVGCVVCGSEVQARGVIARNTLRNGWGFEMWAGSQEIPVEENCIEGNDPGMTVDDSFLVAAVQATNNWWGSPTGPTHESNPSGNGDRILGSKVTFQPFATQPTYCRDTPPAPSCIVVQDQYASSVAGAEVFINGDYAGTTTDEGKLCLSFQVGDQIVARTQVHEEKVVKNNHRDGWTYRAYLTSMTPDPLSGEPVPFTVRDTTINQRLTLWPTQALIGFNILVSVEWDASPAYLADLRRGFELASAYLYDATDGQMLFEQVEIGDAARAFADADYQIKAMNDFRPEAHVAGIVSGPTRHAYFGRAWPAASTAEGQWTRPAGYRTLIHEFGHYGLGLYDSYYWYDGAVQRDSACTGPAIKWNESARVNATLMDYQYNASEFAAESVPGIWSDWCYQTHQYQVHRESDWDTIARYYSGSGWTTTTPAAHGAVIAGPDALPVAEWSRVSVVADENSGACDPPPTIQVELPGEVRRGVQVTLERQSGQIIPQGLTDRTGKMVVLGAAAGDTVHLSYRSAEMESPLTVSAQLSCAQEQLVPPAPPPEPPPLALDVRVVPGATAGEAEVLIQASAALAGPPLVSWRQTAGGGRQPLELVYDEASMAYRGTLALDETLAAVGDLWIVATSMEGRTVTMIFPFKIITMPAGESSRVWSADGKVALYLPPGALTADARLVIAPATGLPAPAGGRAPGAGVEELLLVSGPVTISAAEGVTLASPAALTVYITAAGDAANVGSPSSARLYRWQDGGWLPLAGTGDGAQKYATAAIDALGTFAVFAEPWADTLYLPLAGRP